MGDQTKKLHSRENHQQNEKTACLTGRKIFANHLSDRGLISKSYIKSLFNSVSKTSSYKWTEHISSINNKEMQSPDAESASYSLIVIIFPYCIDYFIFIYTYTHV